MGRIEICHTCKTKWNVSRGLQLEPGQPYECPHCARKRIERRDRDVRPTHYKASASAPAGRCEIEKNLSGNS